MAKIIIGWTLLALGVLILLWAGWSSYEIFTGSRPLPELFENVIKQPTDQTDETTSPVDSGENLELAIKETLKEQLSNIMPSEFMSKMMNLGSWAILVGILIFVGSKVAIIGIKLLATIPKENNND